MFDLAPSRLHPLLIVLAVSCLLASCAGYKEKALTSNDECQDCPPGVVSGEEGAVRWEW
jgi:hypothetical protein